MHTATNIRTELSIVPQQTAIRPKNAIDASVPIHISGNNFVKSVTTECPEQTDIMEITLRKKIAGIIDIR